jgi:hypothetical protein
LNRILALLAFLPSLALAQGASPRPEAGGGPSSREVLESIEQDMRTARAEAIAKNLQLDKEQAARFWPVYERYVAELAPIFEEQMQGVKKYVESYDKLDDATALGLVTALIDRDARMAALRTRWLGEFQKVVPGRLAAKFMQIDRRLSLATQTELAARIPIIR